MAKADDELSTREAARLLNCTVQTVRNYYHAGLLTGRVEVTGALGFTRLWVRREDVERLAQGEAQR